MSVKLNLTIEAYVECPECSHDFDLLIDSNLNETGWLLDKLCPAQGIWIDSHENFRAHTHCPECSAEFDVDGVDW